MRNSAALRALCRGAPVPEQHLYRPLVDGVELHSCYFSQPCADLLHATNDER